LGGRLFQAGGQDTDCLFVACAEGSVLLNPGVALGSPAVALRGMFPGTMVTLGSQRSDPLVLQLLLGQQALKFGLSGAQVGRHLFYSYFAAGDAGYRALRFGQGIEAFGPREAKNTARR